MSLLLDAFPLALTLPASPERRLANALGDGETVVLVVHPEVAVQRKSIEPVERVRRLARAMMEPDWAAATRTRFVDAGQPFPNVLLEATTATWSEL